LATNFQALEGGNGKSRFCRKLPQSLLAPLLAKKPAQLNPQGIPHTGNVSESSLHI
jgi:hypothetical protein